MSDLEIRSGGAIAVDTEQLRAVAWRLREFGIRLGEFADRARWVATDAAATASGFGVDLEARWLASGAERVAEQPAALAAALDGLAAAYELVELRVQQAAATAAGDTDTARAIESRMAVLQQDHPDAARAADTAVYDWRGDGPIEMARQVAAATWWIPGMALPLAVGAGVLWSGVALAGLGRMSRPPGSTGPPAADAAATGTPTPGTGHRGGTRHPVPGGPATSVPPAPTVVRAVAPAAVSGPVTGLADAARRVPGAAEARIRVERYAMPGGGSQAAVYIAGTQAVSGGSGDPFDMRSNLELYRGERSASLESVELALREAGVDPGEPVHVFGHSQGAMLASALALEGTYDVQTLITYGSPVEAAVPDGVLSVGIRHTDDPVAGLAGGGHAETVGAPGSFVAERVADPGGGVQDLTLAAHGIERYAETAAMVDASSDPRAAALRDLWSTLGSAERVEVTEYAADRGSG
ncbi:alpha/beta fold hydrolase [Microbacterium schleiferi]|uniref:Alpha/beta hydrolase n=1 Tax=Microbacterium schleiferi TaxID=69362 RepID=A0ABU7V9H0_9MICO